MDKVSNNQEYFELMRIKTFVENIPKRHVDLTSTPYRLPSRASRPRSDGQVYSSNFWQTLRSSNGLSK